MPRLERIVRYPVKGLRGQRLDAADLVCGAGLAYDRSLAIENGTVAPADGWEPRESFFHLAKNAELIRHTAEIVDTDDGPAVRFDAGEAGPMTVRLSGPGHQRDIGVANQTLARALPAGRTGPPRLTMRGVGMWDHQDAYLSLINLDTVDELGERAGRTIDPMRFRSNLYVSGIGAWRELDLIGNEVRVGDATLQIMWPTDRCRATTVDPTTGDTALNLPALLAGGLGHMFCGVYARVASPGRIEPGDHITVGGAAARTGVASTTSTRRWPRRAIVTSSVRESADVTSVWLRDPFGFAQQALPGQHIRVHPPGDPGSALWRCYTISGVAEDAYRISVKRDGTTSRLLHQDLEVDDGLIVSGPFGDVTLDVDDPSPLLLLSAGIGITPTLAMLRACAGSRRDIRVLHVERGPEPSGLWCEARDLVAELPGAIAARYVSGLEAAGATAGGAVRTPADDAAAHGRTDSTSATGVGATPERDARRGRPAAADVESVVASLSAAPLAYVCGPEGFYEDMRDALLAAGVEAQAIRREVFFSPSAPRNEERAPSYPGPFAVRFADPADEDAIQTWDEARGTLLDVGESLGIAMPSGCRAGACASCALRVSSGSTEYVRDPVVPAPDGKVLLCSAVPTSDVTVDLT